MASARSAGAASRRFAAIPRICPRTSCAARYTADPPSDMLRLPLVPPPYCTRRVSPNTTEIRSIGIASASATIWANPVASPCPWGDVPVTTVAVASLLTRTVPSSQGPNPQIST